jgi:hypothetical protein
MDQGPHLPSTQLPHACVLQGWTSSLSAGAQVLPLPVGKVRIKRARLLTPPSQVQLQELHSFHTPQVQSVSPPQATPPAHPRISAVSSVQPIPPSNASLMTLRVRFDWPVPQVAEHDPHSVHELITQLPLKQGSVLQGCVCKIVRGQGLPPLRGYGFLSSGAVAAGHHRRSCRSSPSQSTRT